MSVNPDLLVMEANMRDYSAARRLQLESNLRILEHDQSNAAAFVATCRALARSEDANPDFAEASGFSKALDFSKAAAETTLDEAWVGRTGRDLSDAYLASIAEFDLLRLLGQYARVLPPKMNHVLIGSGAVANVITEGEPKVVVSIGTATDGAEFTKSAAVVVLSTELERQTSGAANRLFTQELRSAVIRSSNAGALASFQSGMAVPWTGDAMTALTAGLAEAADSLGYVVATSPRIVRELAVAAEGRMDVSGGEYIPGVHVIAVEAQSGSPAMRIIPASRVALIDLGLTVRNASQATVNMADSPTSPSNQVSLWQTNCKAILVERTFSITSGAPIVEVG